MKRTLLIVLALVLLLGGAYFAYSELSPNFKPETAAMAVAELKAPDFTVQDAEGNAVTLSGMLTKPVVVNFWNTWCGPCCSELPAFDSAAQTYADKVNFMMVNLVPGEMDGEDGVKAFLEENGYTFPVYFDTEYSGAQAYGVYSIPMTVIIGMDGEIAFQQVGAMEEETLIEALDAVIGG